MGKIKSVREQVYEHVVHMIRTGELNYGDKINIIELQDSLEVSRPPINEALIQLAADGILDNVPRKGFFVKSMSERQLIDTYEVIGMLDLHAAFKAMDNATEKNIDMMRMTVSKIEEAIEKENYDEYYDLQEGFHRAYHDICGNPVLIDVIEDLLRRVIRTTAVFANKEQMYAFFRKSNLDHAEIVECIENKDRERAPDLIMNHWKRYIRF